MPDPQRRPAGRCTPTAHCPATPSCARSPARSSPRRATCRSSRCTATSTPACSRATSRSPTRRRCSSSPDHYLVRMLVSQGVPHDALGVPARATAATSRPTRARSGAPSPRTGTCSAARPRGSGWSTCSSTCSASTRGRRPRPPTRLYDHIAGAARRARSSGRARCSTGSASRSSRRPTPPTADLADHADAGRAEGWGERVVPTFRPDALLHVDRPGWRAGRRAARERVGRRRSARTATSLRALEARRRAFVAAGARATDHGHLLADTTPLRARRGASGSFAAALRGDVDAAADARRSRRTCCSRWPGCPREDGLVMQLHPGVAARPRPRVAARARPDVGYDIPVPTEYVRALRPLLRGVRAPPRPAAGAVHASTRTRSAASSRRSPASTRRCGSARRGGSSTPRTACGGSARRSRTPRASTTPPASSTTPARSARSPRGTTWPAGSTRGSWPGWSPSTGCDLDEAVETAVDLAYRIPREAYAPPETATAFPTPRAKEHQSSETSCNASRPPPGPGRRHRRRGARGRPGPARSSRAGCPSPRSPSGRPPPRTRSARWRPAATSWSAPARSLTSQQVDQAVAAGASVRRLARHQPRGRRALPGARRRSPCPAPSPPPRCRPRSSSA